MRNKIGCIASLLLVLLVPIASAQVPPITLSPFVSGLNQPVFLTHSNDGTSRKFIVEQPGRILVVQPGSSSPTVFLDIRSRILSGGERGLLGLAFHPQFPANGRLFVNYTRQPDGATVIAEYRLSTSDTANPNSEIVLLTIAQPFENHNGGMIAFGPDNFLYIGMGDGGSGNDPGNRSQNVNDLLGKMLRIDVDNGAGSIPYSSPGSNPFFGATAGRDEIFALGFRNPWRFSFDRLNGQLYVGDVGQNAIEEIAIVKRGENHGWRVLEGTRCTGLGPASCSGPFVPPIAEYGHSGGRCSVTGGYVYRGTRSSLPYGSYVFADFCTGEIFLYENGTTTLLLNSALNISSFGEDDTGELYVVALGGAVYRIVNSADSATNAFTIALPANGGIFVPVSAEAPGLSTGYAEIEANPGTVLGDGVGFLKYRPRGVLASEAALPTSPRITAGRTLAVINSSLTTGFAIANPNDQAVTMNFYFTDSAGQNFGQGSTVISARTQFAAFLDQSPFNGNAFMDGTFTFTTTSPVSAMALNGSFNARSEFIFTSVPVYPLTGDPPTGQMFPQFALGSGWTTDFTLVNLFDDPASGAVVLREPNGQVFETLPYSIAPRSSQHLAASRTAVGVQTGSGFIVPSVGVRPAGLALVRLNSAAGIAAQAGIPASAPATDFRTYVEMSSTIQTGLALANSTGAATTITVTLTPLSGIGPVQTGTVTLQADEQISLFFDQIPGLTAMTTPFQGVARITSTNPVVAASLRVRTNERGEILLTSNTAAIEARTSSLFPHIALGAGFELDMVWINSATTGAQTGTVSFFGPSGSSFPVRVP
jgi:glucose/arabinose dehydrogenase